ncbi:MAG: DAK2 domain-containing protein [Oscillospiraceae bacterium]|nr:DAK2 domain-containing protein [Oscillospiraceae bacterium]
MINTIDASLYRKMVLSAAAALENERQSINDLNVFPVPDGDTGTNMCLTFGTAANDIKNKPADTVGKCADMVASATLRGARGNSGVILSLLCRGFSKATKGLETITGADIAAGMKEGVDAAYKAVMKPAEGTILTVSRLAAERALEAVKENDSAEYVLEAAIERGWEVLPDTMLMNPVLKKAGVVDAGAKGLLYLLSAALDAMRGKETEYVPAAPAAESKADFSDFSTEDITFAYCTEFIVSRENDLDYDTLRPFLDGIGDSAVVVGDEEIIKVHVHTNDPGKVLTQALKFGSFATVKIENMRLQHTEQVEIQETRQEAENIDAEPIKEYGFVSVCAGDGIARMFKDLGVDQIISGGQTMNPSTEDILIGIRKTPARTVFVMPNNKNIIMAAEQCIGLTDKNVVVIPTKTVPQGITAMLAYQPSESAEDNKSAMMDMMAGVRTMQITYAARDSEFDGYTISEGDILAMDNGALFGSGGTDMAQTLAEMARSCSDAEFIDIFYGTDISEDDAQEALGIFEEECPDAEVSLIYGGQPVYYYLISVQ